MRLTVKMVHDNMVASLIEAFQKKLPGYIIVSRHFVERAVERELDMKKVSRILRTEIYSKVCELIFQQFLEDREDEGTCITIEGYVIVYKFVRETNRLWLKSIYRERV